MSNEKPGERFYWAKAAAKRAKRREIYPGYPIMEPFKTEDEVRSYFTKHKIVCLLCGKSFKGLATHLISIHGWTTDDYRAHYGIPWGKGLCSEDTSINYSVAVKKRQDVEKLKEGLKIGREKMALNPPHHRKKAESVIDGCMQRIKKFPNFTQFFDDDDFDKLISFMIEKDLTMTEVCALPGFPARTTVREKKDRDPLFAQKMKKAHQSLSFKAQARAEQLGDGFLNLIVNIRRETGFPCHKIASMTGVSTMTVQRRLSAAGEL